MAPARIASALAALFVTAGVHADGGSAPVPRDPANPRAEAPPVAYQSPFAGYRKFQGEGPGSWKAANDEVGRIGGWKAYAREVYEANEAARRASPPPAGGGAAVPRAPAAGAR